MSRKPVIISAATALVFGITLFAYPYPSEVKIKSYSDSKVFRESDQNGAPTLTLSYSLELPSQGLNQTVSARINPILIEKCLSKKYVYRQDMDSAIKQCMNETYNELKNDLDMTVIDQEWPQQYSYDWAVSYDGIWKNYICFTYTASSYTGGAHPLSYIETLNFDTVSGKRVLLKDFLKEGCEGELTRLIKKDLSNQEVEYWDDPVYALDNFFLQEKGIEFWFNQYEVAPYCYGAPTVVISWEQLKPYMKIKL